MSKNNLIMLASLLKTCLWVIFIPKRGLLHDCFELGYLNELFSDFPAEDSRVFLLVLLDLILNLWSGHSGLGSTNHSRSD